jgi:hypothetical protein
LLAQLILIEASSAQFAAHIAPDWSLAGFPISAAIPFTLFSQPVLVFTGTAQFVALGATATTGIVHSDAAWTNLNRLGKDRSWNHEKRRRRDHEYKASHY